MYPCIHFPSTAAALMNALSDDTCPGSSVLAYCTASAFPNLAVLPLHPARAAEPPLLPLYLQLVPLPLLLLLPVQHFELQTTHTQCIVSQCYVFTLMYTSYINVWISQCSVSQCYVFTMYTSMCGFLNVLFLNATSSQ